MLYIWSFCDYLLRSWCPASGMNTTKIKRLKSQVEQVSFQHEMAELARAPNDTEDNDGKIVVCGSSPDTDRHLSPKKKNACDH